MTTISTPSEGHKPQEGGKLTQDYDQWLLDHQLLSCPGKVSKTAEIIEGLLTTIHDITTTQEIMNNPSGEL